MQSLAYHDASNSTIQALITLISTDNDIISKGIVGANREIICDRSFSLPTYSFGSPVSIPDLAHIEGSRTEYPTSGIPNCGIPNDGMPNNGMSSNYIRYM